jgi:hypothetical protein
MTNGRNAAAQTKRHETRALPYVSTPELWRQLITELTLLERDLLPPGDWRRNRQRVQWTQAIAAELRGRGGQLSLLAGEGEGQLPF